MQWHEVINHYIQGIAPQQVTRQVLQHLLSVIDLTSLNDTDTEDSIAVFSDKAISDLGYVAAVCVYPPFVRMMANRFKGTPVRVATVVNFPEGRSSLQTVLTEIARAIADGAQEIDLVFPYQQYLDGELSAVQSFISSCKLACGQQVRLKVILEIGVLSAPELIANACIDALKSGADFLKTSTGKVATGATLEAAVVMLLTLKQLQPTLGHTAGIKISGGIQHVPQALEYMALAGEIMGVDWVTPETFRIGASRLMDEIYQPKTDLSLE